MCGVVASKAHQDLIEDNVIEPLVTGCKKLFGKACSIATGTFHQVRESHAPERGKGRRIPNRSSGMANR